MSNTRKCPKCRMRSKHGFKYRRGIFGGRVYRVCGVCGYKAKHTPPEKRVKKPVTEVTVKAPEYSCTWPGTYPPGDIGNEIR